MTSLLTTAQLQMIGPPGALSRKHDKRKLLTLMFKT